MDFKFCNVSVIIPAYNVERYLDDSLGSLYSQSLPPKEIILVDDCSSDATLAVAALWKRKFISSGVDFTVVELEQNRGAGNARNEGLKRAKEKYVYFLDSDDIALVHLFKDFQNAQNAAPADVQWFSAETIYAIELGDTGSYRPTYPMVDCGLVSRDEALRRVGVSGCFRVNVFMYIFDRKILGALRFLTHNCHEDEAFTVSLLARASKIRCSETAYVQRRVRPNSVMTGRKGQYNADSYLACADSMGKEYAAFKSSASIGYPYEFVRRRIIATIDLGTKRWQKSTWKLVLRLFRAEPLVRRIGLSLVMRRMLSRCRMSLQLFRRKELTR